MQAGSGFGRLLRECRAGARLTQAELAEQSGLSTRAIADMESGRTRRPYRRSVRLLADALGLEGSKRDLLVRESRPAPEAGGVPEAASAVPVARQLPPAVSRFAGRADELAVLTGLLAGCRGAGSAVVISAIAGTAGVGKTGLATHWAHQVAHLFPDGQLYVNLRGYDPGPPVPPADALAGFLRALGVLGRDIPAGIEELAAAYRSLLAGRRILVLLDNARDARQVRPLLPGTAGCMAVVTSRDSLAGLVARDGARRIELDALPMPDAVSLLRELAGARVDADPGAARTLAGLCCGLPLALRLAAELALARPGVPLADLAAELADRQRRLDLLDAGGDPATAVQAVFSWSDQQLDPADARAFRLLGLHPGPDFDAYAMAALAGTGLREARGRLSRLARAHLVQPAVPGRYGMHDLLRRYAADGAVTLGDRDEARERPQDTDPVGGESEQAVGRLLDYYQHAAATAQALLARQSRTSTAIPARPVVPAEVPDLTDRGRALAWARAERGNLLACLDYATRGGRHARVVALTAGLAGLLRQDGPWAEAITRDEAAVRAARHLGDRVSEAGALSDLGAVRRLTGDYPGAAGALGEALGIFRDLRDRQGQADALYYLGSVRENTGDYPGAAGALGEALGIFRDLGDRQGQGNVLRELGSLRRLTGDYPGAAGALGEALGIFRDLGDRQGQGAALRDLGMVRRMTGDYPGAARALEEALGIYRDLAHRRGQGSALSELGAVRQRTGDYPGAAGALEEALGIFRDLGDRLGQGNALTELGAVRWQAGDYPGAAGALDEALGIFRDLGDRGGEAQALNETGTLHRVRGDLDQALACHRQALHLARQIGSAWDEARALAGLGRCALADGHTASARASLRQAQEIFAAIGAAEASDVTAELSALPEAGPPAGTRLIPSSPGARQVATEMMTGVTLTPRASRPPTACASNQVKSNAFCMNRVAQQAARAIVTILNLPMIFSSCAEPDLTGRFRRISSEVTCGLRFSLVPRHVAPP